MTLKKKSSKAKSKTKTKKKIDPKQLGEVLTETLKKVAQEPIKVTQIKEQSDELMDEPQTAEKTSKTPIEQTTPTKQSKLARMVELLQASEGIALKELAEKLQWLENSVRGAMSLYVKKHPEYTLVSEKSQGVRTYRLENNLRD